MLGGGELVYLGVLIHAFVGVVSHVLVVYVCAITLFGVFGCTSMGLDLGGSFSFVCTWFLLCRDE